MKRILTCLALTLACFNAAKAQPTRVLFIGNSFTAAENVPELVKSFADKHNLQMEVFMHAPGGVSVGDVSQGQMAHMNNPQVFDMIRNHQLDYVVLQDNQGRFVNDHSFPDTNVSKVIAGHMKILDSMRHYNSCAHMIFFAGWALKNCWPDIGTGQKCIENIYDNYLTLNSKANEIIAPIGIAWLRSTTQLPGLDLWSPDQAHQSHAGGYLTAATIFTSIYRINTEDVDYAGNLDTADARILRRIAYQTVTDSVQPTGLAAIAPKLTYNGTALVAPTGFTLYQWFKSGMPVASATTNTYTPPAGKDCYQVAVTDANNCKQYSLLNCLNVVVGVRDVDKEVLAITPNPANTHIKVSTGNITGTRYSIVDMMGRNVSNGNISGNSINLDISQWAPGIFNCTIFNSSGIVATTRFVKENN